MAPAYIDANLSPEAAINYAKWICQKCESDDIPIRMKQKDNPAEKPIEKETKIDATASANGAKLIWATDLSQDYDLSFCNIEYLEIEGEHFGGPHTCAVAYQLGLNWLYRQRSEAFTAFDKCYNIESGSCMLENGRTVNIQYSANTLMGKLRDMVVACGVPADHVIIGYSGGNGNQVETNLSASDPMWKATRVAEGCGVNPAGIVIVYAREKQATQITFDEMRSGNDAPILPEPEGLRVADLTHVQDFSNSDIYYLEIDGDRFTRPRNWADAFKKDMTWLLRRYPKTFKRVPEAFSGGEGVCTFEDGTRLKIFYNPTWLMKKLKASAEICGLSPSRIAVGYIPPEDTAWVVDLGQDFDLTHTAVRFLEMDGDCFNTPKTWVDAFQWGMNWLQRRYPWMFRYTLTLFGSGRGKCVLKDGTTIPVLYERTWLMKKLKAAAEVCGLAGERIVVGYVKEGIQDAPKTATGQTFVAHEPESVSETTFMLEQGSLQPPAEKVTPDLPAGHGNQEKPDQGEQHQTTEVDIHDGIESNDSDELDDDFDWDDLDWDDLDLDDDFDSDPGKPAPSQSPWARVLAEGFPEGYIPGDFICQMQASAKYEELFGVACPLSDEAIDDAVAACGVLREGRLFPHSADTSDLLESICDEIAGLLADYNCVYPSRIYEKFEKPLAEQAIYSNDAMIHSMVEHIRGRFALR